LRTFPFPTTNFFFIAMGLAELAASDNLNKPDEFLYDAFDGLKLDLDKVQSLAIDIAFITLEIFLLFDIDPRMRELICTKPIKLRKLMFVAASLCWKRAPILEELDHGPVSQLLKALYNDVSQKHNTLSCKGVLATSEKRRPLCPWKLGKGTADDSPDAREWKVLPKGVEQWNLS
jgi:hypothetical protein